MIFKKYFNTYTALLLLFIISIVTHAIFFGHPKSVVFDEVHIGKYVLWHLDNSYFFDVHPPLGRLIFAFFAFALGGTSNGLDFSNIGNTLPDWVIYLRLVPLFFGILLPPIIYGILRKLNVGVLLSFIGGLLICLENSLIVQTRFLLTDSFMILFGFISLLIYLYYKNDLTLKYRNCTLYTAIFFASLAFCIKWIGLSFIGLIVFFEIFSNLKFDKSRILYLLKFLSISGLIFISVYLSVLAINIKVLPNSGDGDPYMSPEFQKTLKGNIYENDIDIVAKDKFYKKFLEINAEMISANNRLVDPHNYASKWYEWPLMYKPIYYWSSIDDENIINTLYTKAHIYFIGNPLAYWLGILAIIFLTIKLLINKEYRHREDIRIVLFGFYINFLPFILIGRIMFLYHYACALIFSVIAIILILNKIENRKYQYILVALLVVVYISLYLYFGPLTYGLQITDEALKNKMWLDSWR